MDELISYLKYKIYLNKLVGYCLIIGTLISIAIIILLNAFSPLVLIPLSITSIAALGNFAQAKQLNNKIKKINKQTNI